MQRPSKYKKRMRSKISFPLSSTEQKFYNAFAMYEKIVKLQIKYCTWPSSVLLDCFKTGMFKKKKEKKKRILFVYEGEWNRF